MDQQAQARELYKEQTEEIEHALAHTARFRNAIVVLLSIIVVLSVAFEVGAEKLQHHVPEKTRPVVDILFKELTVLGFIALFVFLAVETGFPQRISEHIFGTPSELKEMFEFIHFLLFLIIVFYLIIVAVVIGRMVSNEHNWRRMEGLALHSCDDPQLTPEESEFLCVRARFCDDKTTPKHRMAAGFPFCEYLIKHDGHLFEEIVELTPGTWAVVLVLVALVRMYMMLHSETLKLVIFIFFGVCVFGGAVVLNLKLAHIQASLSGFKPQYPGHWLLAGSHSSYGDEESSKLLAYQRCEPPPAPEGGFWRFLYGSRAPTQHENLFWFRVNGVTFMLNTVRTMLFLVAIFFALLWVRFANHFESASGILIFLVAVTFPTMTIVFLAPSIVRRLTICTSIEDMRKHSMAARLQFSYKKHRCAMHMRLAAWLRMRCKKEDPNCVLHGHSAREAEMAVKTLIDEITQHHDEDSDGFFSWQEFSDMLQSLNFPQPAGITAVRSVIGDAQFGGDDDLSKTEVEQFLIHSMGDPVALSDDMVEKLMQQANDGVMPESGAVHSSQLAALLARQVSSSHLFDVTGLLLDLGAPTDVMGMSEVKDLLHKCVCKGTATDA